MARNLAPAHLPPRRLPFAGDQQPIYVLVMTSLSSRLAGTVLAVAIGLATVFGAFAISQGEPISGSAPAEEQWIRLLNAAWLACPFLVLSLAGIDRLGPWLTALTITLALWGLFAFSARNGPGDANIGLGLLMLVSPIAITGLALIVDRLGRKG